VAAFWANVAANLVAQPIISMWSHFGRMWLQNWYFGQSYFDDLKNIKDRQKSDENKRQI